MNKFKELLEKHPIVLVDFYADWCAPCRMMGPILSDLKQSVGKKVEIVKINIDTPQNHSVTSAYSIRVVPTIILFKHGKPVWQHSGVVSAVDLHDLIQKHRSTLDNLEAV